MSLKMPATMYKFHIQLMYEQTDDNNPNAYQSTNQYDNVYVVALKQQLHKLKKHQYYLLPIRWEHYGAAPLFHVFPLQ